jgi:(1->4)-alpha-D-glucan 1-alpha-D-glucosylmutase
MTLFLISTGAGRTFVTDFRCTYRLQLTPDSGFDAVRAAVPYLRDLGVSHLYLSPILQARHGSRHGYDVVDPTRISEDLGGERAFRELCEAARARELGVVLDVVPNHMAADEEQNRYWREEREKFFDFDPATGWHRRFFDIDDLAGVRVEDPDVFAETHRKVLELVDEELVNGLRIDHPDGLADPRGYLERLRERGVSHVWVEKILEPGERLRDWPTDGTTGYEFANDVTALFVDPAGEEPLTELYAELTSERRPFAEIAHEAKLEQARTTFSREFDRLRVLLDRAACAHVHNGEGLERAAAAMHVYRTYVEPWSARVDAVDQDALAGLPDELRGILLLERRSAELDEFVTRWQQTTGPVMAKGVEDTAFYRYVRLTALNEVGGNPDRFSLAVDEFHRANLERAERFPRHLLTTQTHDTKRSGDVRARIAAIAEVPDQWARLVRSWRTLDDPNEDYLLWQTLVGAWPIEEARIGAYMEKALREAKCNTSWVEPNETHEREVRERIARVYAQLPDGFEEFAAQIAARGREISLHQTLLKLTCPGVADIYQGDEHETLSLVDPDNRRPVSFVRRRSEKSELVRRVLSLRAELPEVFNGNYEPLDVGPDGCAFVRGGRLKVVVPLRSRGPAQELSVVAGRPHTVAHEP